MSEVFLDQRPVVGILKGFPPLSFVRVTTKEEELLWNHVVRTWHYLEYQAMIGPRIKYLIMYQDKLLAAISFNQASLRLGVRDAWIGLEHEQKLKLLHHILNNNRFLILPWVEIKNLASHALGKALHLLKADWSKLYGVVPYALEAFVDFNRYVGTCYKAAKWKYMGLCSACYSRKDQQENGETYIKGLLSDLNRKKRLQNTA